MTDDIIANYFDKARTVLKTEHDSMVQKVKEDISQSKKKAMSKI
jgi:hypothetical protein